jgi:hypothetical protein
MTAGVNNARRILLACHMFASDSGGKFPVKIEELVPKYLSGKFFSMASRAG